MHQSDTDDYRPIEVGPSQATTLRTVRLASGIMHGRIGRPMEVRCVGQYFACALRQVPHVRRKLAGHQQGVVPEIRKNGARGQGCRTCPANSEYRDCQKTNSASECQRSRTVFQLTAIDCPKLKFLRPMLHLGLEPRQNRTMHLTDARFGEIQRQTDLLHRHFLVVIQHHDEALGP